LKGGDQLATARETGPETLLSEADTAETAYVESALAHLANATEFLSLEHPLLLDGEGLPAIDVDFTDRHVVVVTGGEDSESQLADLKPFIKEYRPLLVGVDGGADLLRSARHSVDLVVGSPADVSDEALTDAPALVVPADRDGRAEGLERVSELGIGATTFPAAATARDMALLLAFHGGAEMIVVTGGDRGLEDAFTPAAAPSSTMVDKAVATRLVHADACSTLYRSRGTGLGLALVVLAALVAIAAVVVARDSAQDLLVWAVDAWNTFAPWVQGLFRCSPCAATSSRWPPCSSRSPWGWSWGRRPWRRRSGTRWSTTRRRRRRGSTPRRTSSLVSAWSPSDWTAWPGNSHRRSWMTCSTVGRSWWWWPRAPT